MYVQEQVAFSPGNLVPGIEASQDRILQGRLFSYQDTQRHRVGANFHRLPINAPGCPFFNHQRDGTMAFTNGGSAPNFFAGSAPHPVPDQTTAAHLKEYPAMVEGVVGRYDQAPINPDDDFVQVRKLFMDVMTEPERVRLINNIVGHMSDPTVTPDIHARMIALFTKVHAEYGRRVQETLAEAMSG